jgi:tetratricopeptide (TPR) repeat protein
LRAFPIRGFPPDYYEMRFTLKNGLGEILDKASAPFILSPSETVPHPVTIVRALSAADTFLYHLGLAIQYDKIGTAGRAEASYEKAYNMRPDYLDGIVQYADFLLRNGKAREAFGLVDKLRDNEKFRFNYFLLKGRAHLGMGEFGPAIENLLEGNKIYNSDTVLLNALGTSYYRTGRKKEALDALNASLRLNPEQPNIKELVARVQKELK